MARATDAEVRKVIETDPDISMNPFIAAASDLVDYVAESGVDGKLTAAKLARIETWLAAHFYAVRDQPLQEEQTEKASGVYQGKTGVGLASRYHGQMALRLDITGTLARLDRQSNDGGPVRAGAVWLGTAYS